MLVTGMEEKEEGGVEKKRLSWEKGKKEIGAKWGEKKKKIVKNQCGMEN